MRVETFAFNYPSQLKRLDYHRLIEVFEYSLHHHVPDADIRARIIEPPDHRGAVKIPFLSNTYKLAFWVAAVEEAYLDGENLILSDSDMLCTGNPEPVFEREFDIAYTVRDDHTNIPLNGGVVYVKPTEAARRFMQEWLKIDERMYEDWNFHQPWRIKYAGQNQASFGYLLENPVEGVTLLELPTRIYNAVNTDWHRIGSDTVFIHIKSQLRKAVLRGEPPTGTMRPAMLKWYEERDRVEGAVR